MDGQAREFRDARQLSVRFGNSPAVRVTQNGKDVGVAALPAAGLHGRLPAAVRRPRADPAPRAGRDRPPAAGGRWNGARR